MIREKVTACLFLVFLAGISVPMLFSMGNYSLGFIHRRIFQNDEKSSHLAAPSQTTFKEESHPVSTDNTSSIFARASILKAAILKVESVFGERFVIKSQFVKLNGCFQRLLGRMTVDDANAQYNIVKDTYGRLNFVMDSKMDTTVQSKAVVDFCIAMKEIDLPCVYVFAPTKNCFSSFRLPYGVSDFTRENCEDLLDRIKAGGVPVYDLREDIEDAGLDIESLHFKTDHHWTVPAGFHAFVQVVKRLNSDYHWNQDMNCDVFDLSKYDSITIPRFFLGSQGRRVGEYYAGVDDFSYLIPKFDTKLEVEMHLNDNRTVTKEGSFEHSVIWPYAIEHSAPITRDRYNVYWGTNRPLIKIHNPNGSHKILLIQDSYGLALSAFLSLKTRNLDIVDLRSFQGSIRSYAKNGGYDAVLILYSSAPLEAGNAKMFARLYD